MNYYGSLLFYFSGLLIFSTQNKTPFEWSLLVETSICISRIDCKVLHRYFVQPDFESIMYMLNMVLDISGTEIEMPVIWLCMGNPCRYVWLLHVIYSAKTSFLSVPKHNVSSNKLLQSTIWHPFNLAAVCYHIFVAIGKLFRIIGLHH